MPQDDDLRALERDAAEKAPEVVRWINALRRAGQLPMPSRDPMGDLARTVIESAWYADEGLPVPACVATNHCPVPVEAIGGPTTCGRDISHYIEFDSSRGSGIFLCCTEHTELVQSAARTGLSMLTGVPASRLDVPNIQLVVSYPILNPTERVVVPRARMRRADAALPRVIADAFVHPQRRPTCQFVLVGATNAVSRCGVSAIHHVSIEISGRSGHMHLYACARHLVNLEAEVRGAIHAMTTSRRWQSASVSINLLATVTNG